MGVARGEVTIRPVEDADWPAIWAFMRGIVRAGETYTWPVDATEDEARARWLLGAPWRVVVAVTAAGTLAGTAKYGPNQDGPGDHVANASFMVDPASAGAGVGRLLGEHVLGAARRDGYAAMQFNAVVSTNHRAVALWQSLGFVVLTTVPGAFRHPSQGPVGLHVMHRPL